MAQCDMASPVPTSSVSARHARSSEVEPESPRKTRCARRKTRCAHRRMRPTRVCAESVGVESPTMTVQAIPDLAGAIVYDCRPPLLPVSLRLNDIGLLPRDRPVASASLAAPPSEDTMVIGGASPEGVAISELGVAPPDDSGTDLEDELLNVSLLPTIVSPLTEPVEALPVCPSLYPEPPVPALPDLARRVTVYSTPIDLLPSFLISPAQSYYDPATSPITSDVQDDSGLLPPDSPATMDKYLAADGDLLLGDSSDLPLLSLPLLPIPVADVSVPVLAVTPSVGEQVPVSSVEPPDLSREGPFDVDQTVSGSGAAPRVLESLPGCQYRMTSYNAADRTDLDPAYGLHLLDPRFLEYVGAPESARLLSPAPDYWIHHMDRHQAISAALQLQHDVGLIMSNLQVLGQFVTSLNRMSSEVMRLAFGQENTRRRSLWRRLHVSGRQPITWLRWVCGVCLVPRRLLGRCRPRHAMPA